MIRVLRERLRQGYRTIRWPDAEPTLPDRLRGRPQIAPGQCPADCNACAQLCPTDAISIKDQQSRIALGHCLFCADCAAACPQKAIRFDTAEYRMATRWRDDLIIARNPGQDAQATGNLGQDVQATGRNAQDSKDIERNSKEGQYRLAEALDGKLRRLYGRSLKLRQVSAGGCNACEADVNVLSTIVFDLGRFGIQVVASPRHADGLLITGPVPENMRIALQKTWEAVPPPRLVIAVGACAISGGPYVDHPEVHNGAEAIVPVDLYIPGCPPHPMTILDGLVRLLGRLE